MAIIYVQAVFHRSGKHKKAIDGYLKENGWKEFKFSGYSDIWRGDNLTLRCNNQRDLELKAEKDFFSCAILFGVRVTLMYQVNKQL